MVIIINNLGNTGENIMTEDLNNLINLDNVITIGIDVGIIVVTPFVENTVIGTSGDDILGGGNYHADSILGLGGDDTVYGYAYNDTIITGSGDDYIDGGDGNDSIDAGLGDDFIVGGDGDDIIITGFAFTNPKTTSTVYGGKGDDTIIHDNDGYIDAGDGDDEIYGFFTLSPYGNNISIYGGDGNDTISGRQNIFINSGNGNDLVRYYLGNNHIYLGEGQDTLSYQYDSLSHNTSLVHDVIYDFDVGEDMISLNNVISSFDDIGIYNNTDGNAVIYLTEQLLLSNNLFPTIIFPRTITLESVTAEELSQGHFEINNNINIVTSYRITGNT